MLPTELIHYFNNGKYEKRILYITPFSGMNMDGQVSLFHLIDNLSTKLYTPLLVTPNEGELSDKIIKIGHQVFIDLSAR